MIDITIGTVSIGFEKPAEFVIDGAEPFNLGIFTITNSAQREPYPDYADVVLTINGVDYEACIHKDVSRRLAPDLYEHKITLAEPVIKLSRYTMADRLYDTIGGSQITYEDQADNILLTHNFGKTSPLTIATATRTLLDTLATEKEFTGGNLLTTFVDMFRSVNAVPTLSLDNEIGHEAFGDLATEISIGAIIGELITSDIGDYGLAVHSKVKNGTYEADEEIGTTYFPSKDSGITPRSLEPKFTDLTAKYIIDSGVRKIPETYMMNLELDTGGGSFFVEADFSQYVVSKEEWDNLIIERTTSTLQAGVYRNNSLWFTEGDNLVQNAGERYEDDTTVENLVMENIIHSWLVNNGYVTTDWVPQLIKEMELRFKYQASRDMDCKVERHNIDRVVKNATVINNQKDSKLELARYGTALKSHINRIGNDKYEITIRYNEYTPFTLYSLNDYTSDGYKIIKIHVIANHSSMDVIYQLTKNQRILNPITKVNRAVSPFTIQKRNVLSCFMYTEYLEFAGTSRTDDGLLTTLGKEAILNALKWDITKDLPIYNAQYVSTSNGSVRLNMSATKQPMGGALVFNAQFKHQKFAGYQFIPKTGAFANDISKPIPYGDVNGEVETFDMRWYNNLTSTANTFPVGSVGTNPLISSKTYDVGLNPNEILGLSFHIQPITDRSNLIIGDYFASNNSLMKELSVTQGKTLYYYDSTVKHTIYDKVRKSGSTGSGTFALDSAYKEITIGGVPAGSSWVLAKSTAPYNIYMIYNYEDSDLNTIYINNLEDRPDIETL